MKSLYLTILLFGVAASFPVFPVFEINPENAEAGDNLRRVKKNSKIDTDMAPENTPTSDSASGADSGKEAAPTKKETSGPASTVLDLKAESSNTKFTPVLANAPAAIVDSKPRKAALIAPASQSISSQDEGHEEVGLSPQDIQRLLGMFGLTALSGPGAGANEKMDSSLRQQSHSYVSQAAEVRSNTRDMTAPAKGDIGEINDDDDNSDDPNSDAGAMTMPQIILAKGPSRMRAEGAQAMPPLPYAMYSHGHAPYQGYQPMVSPMDNMMLRQIVQDQAEIKQMLMRIGEQQAALHDSLYRIERHVVTN